MAQAARLNLRLQKELKLLMTDPPPGVSFPSLSDNQNQSSLSLLTIEACIEGPEQTVYSKGIFIVKIQIPERYPFHPPNVTFVTPIYHPNIDNGGRICLDILNLPPKAPLEAHGALVPESSDQGSDRMRKKLRLSFTKPTTPVMPSGMNNNAEKEVIVLTDEIIDMPAKQSGSMRRKLHLPCQNLSAKTLTQFATNNNDEKEKITLVCEKEKQMTSCSKLFQYSSTDFDNASTADPKQLEATPEFLDSIIVSDSEESDDDDSQPLQSRFSRLRNQSTAEW